MSNRSRQHSLGSQEKRKNRKSRKRRALKENEDNSKVILLGGEEESAWDVSIYRRQLEYVSEFNYFGFVSDESWGAKRYKKVKCRRNLARLAKIYEFCVLGYCMTVYFILF